MPRKTRKTHKEVEETIQELKIEIEGIKNTSREF